MHFLLLRFLPFCFSAVAHEKRHRPQSHADTVPAETNFQLVSKETREPQVSCVVPGQWESLCNPKLVVESCLSKSEVMFFFFFFGGARASPEHFQLLSTGGNRKNGSVLATEMRWKPTNMLSKSGTEDKGPIPNLRHPPQTSWHSALFSLKCHNKALKPRV